ncbi:MAG TPA: hypothetical protein VF598_11205 [Hymenobacter sp.]|jgi:hypothetical protein
MKFAQTSCSQCGQTFGPGDHGFSHCDNHRNRPAPIVLPTGLQLARRAVRLYSCDLASKATNRFNQRSYIRAVQQLGPRWLLAAPMQKEARNG